MITAPGCYDIPIDIYLGDCAPGVSVSASGLTKILDCPARYWVESYLNPNRMPRTTSALNFGRSAHAWVLGEPEWNKNFVIAPFDDFRSKEARAWRDSETRTIVRAAEFETIKAMAAAIRTTPQTANALCAGKAEQSLIWKDDATGIWLKARPDFLPDKPATHFVQEYKTTVSLEPQRIGADAFRYGYDIQAALIYDGLTAVTGTLPLGIAHIVQEKEPPYLCELKMFSREQIEAGRTRYRHALRIFARCLKAGTWPGYSTEPSFFETPKWVMDQVVEMDDDDSADTDSGNEFGRELLAG